MTDQRLQRLTEQIRDAGVPIDGLSGTGPGVRIDFRPEATPAQRTQAAGMVAAFNWAPRRPRALADVTAAVQALSTADRNLLLSALAAEFLRQHPEFATRLGVNVPGDEVIP